VKAKTVEITAAIQALRPWEWTGMRVARLYSGLEDRRVSLNTYARRKWNREMDEND